jgi:deoxyadenosine/deoxycytidine kinase
MDPRARRHQRAQLITIEGNIGVGKSTVVSRLEEALRQILPKDTSIAVVPEPVEEWVAHGFLERAYEEHSSRAAFQVAVLASLASKLIAALQESERPLVIISERSVWSNAATFAKVNLCSSPKDLELYTYTFNNLLRALRVDADVHHVYLRADTNTLAARVAERARVEEARMPIEYLSLLNQAHEDWISSLPIENTTVVDATGDKDVVFQKVVDAVHPLANPTRARETPQF